MDVQLSVDQIIDKAAHLSKRDLDRLVSGLSLLRARRATPALSKAETNLLTKINAGFPLEKRARIAQLDEKIEFSELSAAELEEHLALAEALEAYTVQRFIWLKELAILRGIPLEQLMQDMDITPR